MKENTQRFQHIMLYYFQKGKNAIETQKQIYAVYGEGVVTDWTCQKWFAKFCARDLSLDDAPWLGRPVEVDSNQIEALIENNQCYITQEIANIFKIPKSIKLFVKMKNVSYILLKTLNGLFWPTEYYQLLPGEKTKERQRGEKKNNTAIYHLTG